MSGEKSEIELSRWFSTYGMITAERILARYNILLSSSSLVIAIKSPFSFYHKLLNVPLKNVLNGIVLQQANDYHIYVQKLFIDYLLSGENSKEGETQGAETRELLEEERTQLVDLGEEFHQKEIEHSNLIATSQAAFIKITREFNTALEKSITAIFTTLKSEGLTTEKSKIRQAITHALIYCDLTDPQLQSNQFLFTEKMNEVFKLKLDDSIKGKIMNNASEMLDIVLHFDENTRPFLERAEEMGLEANSYRTRFYDTIIRVLDLIRLLPEYVIDPEQDSINREPLYFDKSIGEQ